MKNNQRTTKVRIEILRSPEISLKAKGMYVLLCSAIDTDFHVDMEKRVLTVGLKNL